jgi:DNA-binding PadR family transcriptional regulator
MVKRRPVNNLLALAVLSAVMQRPQHPYEMGRTLRSWGKDRDMGLKWGSLYTVVRNLEKHGLLEAAESTRQGARPERTVYRITDAGRAELVDWVRELVSTPRTEQRAFTAGLSVLSALPPAEVLALLRERVEHLQAELAERRAEFEREARAVPRLFLIEDDYELAVLEAELAWVRGTADELSAGDYPGQAQWAAWHETGEVPADLAALAEGSTAEQN